jgi:UDP-N-acetylglucosamine enolpyruvyl transferase
VRPRHVLDRERAPGDRGYERIDERLRSLGARITREPAA